MLASVREETTLLLSHVEIQTPSLSQMMARPAQVEMHETRQDPAFAEAEAEPALAGAEAGSPPRPAQPAKPMPIRHAAAVAIDPNDESTWGQVPRNAPCPCGSGKKYKHCHGKTG